VGWFVCPARVLLSLLLQPLLLQLASALSEAWQAGKSSGTLDILQHRAQQADSTAQSRQQHRARGAQQADSVT
jgi:hypothetical protein